MRALSFLAIVAASAASAQTPTSTGDGLPVEVRYQQKTLIEIGEVSIEGVVVGPTTTAVRGGRKPHFKSLIRLRPDFRKELASSTDAL